MGRVGPAHGLDGSVVVDLETDDPTGRFAVGAVVRLADGTQLTVRHYRPTDRSPLVTFAEVADRQAAEDLRGADLYIAPEERRTLAPEEFWPEDLMGAAVVDPDGARLGVVGDVELGWAQDRLYVDPDGGGKRFIVPLVGEFVVDVDSARGVVTVRLPPGLTG